MSKFMDLSWDEKVAIALPYAAIGGLAGAAVALIVNALFGA